MTGDTESTRADSLTIRKQRRAIEAIWRAALDLFIERGYDAVSVTDIAERAEVGRTTFFRYFGDKQEVLFVEHDNGAEVPSEVPGPEGAMAPIGSSLTAASVPPVRWWCLTLHKSPPNPMPTSSMSS